jgi:ABC-type multidrug transport system fused ATPase/permease subunit
MENKLTSIEELFNKFKDYADTRLDLFKLKAINKVSGIASTIVTMVIIFIIFLIVIICISVGAALLLGQLLGASSYGFFIIAVIYLIIGLVLYSRRGNLMKAPISNKLIKEMLD